MEGIIYADKRDAETKHKMRKWPRDEIQRDVAPNSRPERQKEEVVLPEFRGTWQNLEPWWICLGRAEAMEGIQPLTQKPSTQSRYREATCVSFPHILPVPVFDQAE